MSLFENIYNKINPPRNELHIQTEIDFLNSSEPNALRPGSTAKDIPSKGELLKEIDSLIDTEYEELIKCLAWIVEIKESSDVVNTIKSKIPMTERAENTIESDAGKAINRVQQENSKALEKTNPVVAFFASFFVVSVAQRKLEKIEFLRTTKNNLAQGKFDPTTEQGKKNYSSYNHHYTNLDKNPQIDKLNNALHGGFGGLFNRCHILFNKVGKWYGKLDALQEEKKRALKQQGQDSAAQENFSL